MNNRRVVITGLGVVSPLGIGLQPYWQALLEGRHGFAPIRAFDASAYRQKCGAEVDSDLLRETLAREGLSPSDRSVDMGLAAAAEALRHAGLAAAPLPYAAIFGSAIGCSHGWDETFNSFRDKGLRGVRPTAIPRYMNNALSANISIRFRLSGPNYTVVSACASSSAALGIAWRLIRSGAVDGALTGGSDAVFLPVTVAGWNNLGILSPNPEPGLCCRPFDKNRQGTALGEGAAALVLEEREQARARGAAILAEILGFAENSDAGHIANPDAESQARAVRAALREAGLSADDLGFINAHGTGAPVSDRKEAEALRLALGEAAGRIPAVSLKSYFGHTQGACGAMEAVAAVKTVMEGVLPGNRNLEEPDPDCPIHPAGRHAAPVRLRTGLKTSFGFGGHNTALVLGPSE
jgi:3-oxoacyl-[acyl-carrier-protein] synthase II